MVVTKVKKQRVRRARTTESPKPPEVKVAPVVVVPAPEAEQKKPINMGTTMLEGVLNKKKEPKIKEPKPPKMPKPRREKFFHESHPKEWKAFKSIVYIPFLILFAMYYQEFFAMIKWFTGVLMSGVIFNEWFWQTYYPDIIFVSSVTVAVLMFVYYFLWRMAFNDYFVRYRTTDVYDGRIYWSDSFGIVKWWDKVYRSPERKVIKHWVRQKFFSITPTVIYTTPEESVEKRDSWAIVVHEHRLRKVLRKERKRLHVQTYDGVYVGHKMDLTYAQNNFAARSQELRDATTYLSQANHNVQVDAVKGSTVRISDDFRRRVLDARRKQREAAEQSAAQPDH